MGVPADIGGASGLPPESPGPSGPPAPALPKETARQLLKALAEPIRIELIAVLASGERCVCDLQSDLGLAQSRLSFHLKVMKQAGLVADRQEGRWVYYRLRAEAIDELCVWLTSITARCGLPARTCR